MDDITATMPFGKFRGERLTEVPIHYLVWLLERDFLKEPLQVLIKQVVKQRLGL